MPNLLLGVSGGIAAYKSCELVREFQRRGFAVQVMMTQSAQEFVTPLTFESLSKRPVYTNLFGDGALGTAHIDVARWGDALVIAPLTANTLANLAFGQAPDFLSTVYLAFKGPVFVAPAMNTQMWEHETTQQNIQSLQARGTVIIPPVDGELACGEVGKGKMAEPLQIADLLSQHFSLRQTLKGKKVVVTAGPTREYIDPVRFISNPSTGKMGLEVAKAASERGAEVVLIHGPWNEEVLFPAKTIAVTTAQEMLAATLQELPADIFVGAAAVSDYRAEQIAPQKIKKQNKLEIKLLKNEDILNEVSKRRRPKDLVIGFAAETENLIPNAKLKLESKQLDLVVGNYVHKEEKGFVQDQTDVVFVGKKGVVNEVTKCSKAFVAKSMWDEVEKLYGKN